MTTNMLNPGAGAHILQWADLLARHSEPPWIARGELTATYLTHAHLATAGDLAQLMRESGFDTVTTDAVGNVVGIYRAALQGAPVLMTGSHYDTVRNAGKYDGRLGILVPIACVAALAGAGRRRSPRAAAGVCWGGPLRGEAGALPCADCRRRPPEAAGRRQREELIRSCCCGRRR